MANTSYLGIGPADRDPTVSDDSVTTAKIQDNAVTGPKIAMTSDAAGDILTYTGTDYVRLGIGSVGQALKVASGGTAVEWATDASGTGDVVGPGSSTDDALARFNATTGKLIQNSTATLSDAGTLTATAFSGPLTGNVTGNIDGIVGGTTPAAGTFTTLIGTNVDGIIGANTPAAITGTQVDITAQGDLRLQDTTGGEYVGFQAAATTTTYTITMPATAAASNGQALTTTTAGVGSWSTVGDASLTADQSWTGSQRATAVIDNDMSYDMNAGQNFISTPSANATLTFTNIANGQSGFIKLINSGGYTISLATNSKGDATLTSTISTSGTYLLSYFSDGTDVWLTNSAIYV